MNVLCEFIVFLGLMLMNLFYCKVGDQHYVSHVGFTGSPPCVTVAYWQTNVMMMMKLLWNIYFVCVK